MTFLEAVGYIAIIYLMFVGAIAIVGSFWGK